MNNHKLVSVLMPLCVCLSVTVHVAAQQEKPTLTVAILNFDARDPANPDLGVQISETLTAILTGEPGFTLVERAALARTLQEHELNLSGVVDTEQAVKIGRLVGARVMVTGRAFVLDSKLFITAKLIGTETSLMEAVIVRGEKAGAMDEMLMGLSAKVADRLREAGPKLVAQPDDPDPLVELKAKLKELQRPVVSVVITEQHHAGAQAQSRPLIDPTVETEVKMLLRECGFTIQDVPQNELADWARQVRAGEAPPWPRSLEGVDAVITGKAFSEFAARIGNLVSCSARAEVNVITRKDGRIDRADRVTTRAVDLSEQIAGKKALEKAGRELALGLLGYWAGQLPPAQR